MDKFLLQQQVLNRLAEDLLQAEQAVRAAHETATHEENIPTTSEKVYSSARWSAWPIPTTSSNTSFSVRTGAA